MTNNPTRSRKKTAGHVMAAAGFLMILLNALDYLLGWQVNLSPMLIVGLALVVSGTHLSTTR